MITALTHIQQDYLQPAASPAPLREIFPQAIMMDNWEDILLTPYHVFAADAGRECGFYPNVQTIHLTAATPVYTRPGGVQIGYLVPVETYGISWQSTIDMGLVNNRIARWWISFSDANSLGMIRGYVPVLPASAIDADGNFNIAGVNLALEYGGSSLVKHCQFWGMYLTSGGGRVQAFVSYSAVINTSISMADLATLLDGHAPINTDSDPYVDAGYPASTAPGGLSGGTFDFSEDGLTAVHTPSLDLADCGLFTIWSPTKAQLISLASWLWSTTPAALIQQIFGNPVNAIIGLHIMPVTPDTDNGTNTIHLGSIDSGVAAKQCTSQYVTVDCGSLKIYSKYGSYLDYAPHTTADLYLPYVGGIQLDINDVIDKTLSVKYSIDLLSGACVAYVFVDGILHYQQAGNCAADAPMTGQQMPGLISGVLSILGTVAGGVASAGASTAGLVSAAAGGAVDAAGAVTNMLKHKISYAGTISSWAGLMGAQTPYLILTPPKAAIPAGQNTIMGYPAWVSGRIGNFTGFTVCEVDRIDATRATEEEVEEIKALFAAGVIL